MGLTLEQGLLVGLFVLTLGYDVVKTTIDHRRMKDQTRLVDIQAELLELKRNGK